ncbi:kinesin light [Purpureocillium lilacinum]|uniref:Kinesin light n=1 Tax=Purpureocillium lilacinum TaxID=33203 RepID=A0A179FPE0_PURLI|nr:kinesin light [Purpureocillium lilacinum]
MESGTNNSDVPRITVDVESSTSPPEVSTTLPFQVVVTLRRQPDSRDEPCIVKWNASRDGFSEGRFALFHETDTGLQTVDIEVPSLTSSSPSKEEPIQVTSTNQVMFDLLELQPSGSHTFRCTLPDDYQRRLVPGEKYRLQWPGGDITYWGWGSMSDKDGTYLEYQDPKSPRGLSLPASEGFTFTATEEAEPWPGRAEAEAKFGFTEANTMEYLWRSELSNTRRAAAEVDDDHTQHSDPGAPVFSTTLEGPAEKSLSNKIKIVARITLEGSKPVTFHTHRINSAFRLFRRGHDEPHGGEGGSGDAWVPCDRDETLGYFIVDDPDVRVHVARHEDFVSLRPGESWTYEYVAHEPGGADFPADTVPGDRFRVRFAGVELDWWNWGDAEAHEQTEVSLPCFISGDVVDPRDNDGRPKARVEVIELNMTTGSGQFQIGEGGTVGHASGGETNVAVWSPAVPGAFEKARDAAIYTRIGTLHSSAELQAALDATPDIDQTFCLSVNNVILVFSASKDEHTRQVRLVLEMLQGRSMGADIDDCVFDSATSAGAGIQLDRIGHHKVFMVINVGVPSSS